MKPQRKTQITLALIVSIVFLFQSCATIFKGSSQKIPVTSNPSGAKIIVDGEEMGHAPLNIKLKRKKSHIIRVEKKGYNPLEIRIIRKTSAGSSILGNIFWGSIGAIPGFLGLLGESLGAMIGTGLFGSSVNAHEKQKKWNILLISGFIIGWAGGILVDFSSGANYNLTPDNLILTLTKIEGKPQPNLILIDVEQLQNIKWIRIKCAGSNGEEIVNLE